MPAKSKLSKKEMVHLEAERSELLRIEMENQRKRKLEEERQRKQVEREQALQQRKEERLANEVRLQQLECSMSFFDSVQSTINGIKLEEQQQRDWKKFMHCNGLPMANSPRALRQYMHQWRKDSEQQELRARNWLLQTDERTILTHNQKLENRTRAVLKKQQADRGILYAQRAEEVLWILQELDEALSDDRIPGHIHTDLKLMKAEIRTFLKQQLDEFSHKILCYIERDMQVDRAGVYKYVYTSEIFKIHLWVFSEEAQIAASPKTHITEQNPHNEINFPLIRLQMSLPPTVHLPSSALRGLWLSYDHLSDFCATFYLKEPRDKHLNILQQTTLEWHKRKEIFRSILDGNIAEAAQTLAGENLDIDKLFNDHEEDASKARRTAMGPEAYNLLETDVNLRKYRIIGGLYCIDYLEIPQQYKRFNSRRFIRAAPTPDCLKHKTYYQSYKSPAPVLPGVRRLPEEIEAEMRMVEAALDQLASITLELPDSIIWFEPPIVCRWEMPAESGQSDPSIAPPPTNQDEPENINDITKTAERGRKSSTECIPRSVSALNDFDILNIPFDIDIKSVMEDYVNPRLPDGMGICLHPDYVSEGGRLRSKTKSKKTRPKVLFIARPEKVNKSLFQTENKAQKKVVVDFVEHNEPCELFSSTSLNPKLKTHTKTQQIENGMEAIRKPEESIECLSLQKTEKKPQRTRYMFYQLLKDIEQLCARKFCPDHPVPAILASSSSNTRPTLTVSPETEFAEVMPTQSSSSLGRETSVEPIVESEMKQLENQSSSEFDETDDIEGYKNLRPLKGKHGQSVAENRGDDTHTNNDRKITKTKSSTAAVSTVGWTQGKWSTRDVHDVKFNEDKFTIQFRTGRLGVFGIALNRYSNMPYQAWEIKPDLKSPGSILFSFTASIISFDMTITSTGFCVDSFQGGCTESINAIIGKNLALPKLKSILISSAVDIFPEDDTFCYTEGSCEKNFAMEMHLYACMAAFGLSHNFSWSRWNLLAGGRTAVLLMRELAVDKKMPNFSTLLVTPLKATIIDSLEVSASFNPVDIPGMDYYADLYQLAAARCQPGSLHKQRYMEPLLRDNVTNILKAIRPISFC